MLDNSENNNENISIEIDKETIVNTLNETINFDNIILENPVKTDKNKYFCKLNNDFIVQTNILKCINQIYEHENKKYINLSLDCEQLNKLVLNIDNIVVNQIFKNFNKWFHKKVSIKNVLDYFVQTKMHNHNLESFIVLNIPTYEKNIDINIYDKNNNIIYDDFDKIENCVAKIKLNGIYLEKYKFYCSWELIQLKII